MLCKGVDWGLLEDIYKIPRTINTSLLFCSFSIFFYDKAYYIQASNRKYRCEKVLSFVAFAQWNILCVLLIKIQNVPMVS